MNLEFEDDLLIVTCDYADFASFYRSVIPEDADDLFYVIAAPWLVNLETESTVLREILVEVAFLSFDHHCFGRFICPMWRYISYY